MAIVHPLLKKIAWNRISFLVPPDWEVDSLDDTHLMMGKHSTAELEIKWAEGPGQFTLDAFLKKFIVRAQKQLDIIIHERPTPEGFSHPTTVFEFFFFDWEGHGEKGSGTFIFCNHCKRLTLIRFFKPFDGIHMDQSQQILQSFTDHPNKSQVSWAMFGMEFTAPASFDLKEYSFKPGAFRVDLKDRKKHLCFYSWGPATFLLSKMDLSAFARQRVPLISGLARAGCCARGNYLEWSFRKEKFKNANLIPFFNHMSLYSVFRICHDVENNRISGMQIDSPVKFEHDLIQDSTLHDI